jgi:hypothetical protein
MDFTDTAYLSSDSFFRVEDISLRDIDANVERDYASEEFNLDALWKSTFSNTARFNNGQEEEEESRKKKKMKPREDEDETRAFLFNCADESVEKFWSASEDVFLNKMWCAKKTHSPSSPCAASDASSEEDESFAALFLDRLEALAREDEDVKALFFLDDALGEDANDMNDGVDFSRMTLSESVGNKNVLENKFAGSVRRRARDVLLFELERAGFLTASADKKTKKKKTKKEHEKEEETMNNPTIPTSPTRAPKKSSSIQPQPWDNLSFAIDRIRELQKNVCASSSSRSSTRPFDDRKINIVADNVCSSLRDLQNIETRQLNRAKKAMKMTLSVPDGRVLRVIEEKFKHSRKVALVAFENFCAKTTTTTTTTTTCDDTTFRDSDNQENDEKLLNTPTRDKKHLKKSEGCENDFIVDRNVEEEKSKRHGKRVKKILSEWLYENFYPTDTRKRPVPTKVEKKMLAEKTGLTQTQVTDWFVNARARLWKPRVEGIVRSVIDELKKKNGM